MGTQWAVIHGGGPEPELENEDRLGTCDSALFRSVRLGAARAKAQAAPFFRVAPGPESCILRRILKERLE
jgi:hypothetical protein